MASRFHQPVNTKRLPRAWGRLLARRHLRSTDHHLEVQAILLSLGPSDLSRLQTVDAFFSGRSFDLFLYHSCQVFQKSVSPSCHQDLGFPYKQIKGCGVAPLDGLWWSWPFAPSLGLRSRWLRAWTQASCWRTFSHFGRKGLGGYAFAPCWVISTLTVESHLWSNFSTFLGAPKLSHRPSRCPHLLTS